MYFLECLVIYCTFEACLSHTYLGTLNSYMVSAFEFLTDYLIFEENKTLEN